jgi:hypothetical protein
MVGNKKHLEIVQLQWVSVKKKYDFQVVSSRGKSLPGKGAFGRRGLVFGYFADHCGYATQNAALFFNLVAGD